MAKFIDRTGEIHPDIEGNLFEITECLSSLNCTLRFENGEILKNRKYRFIKTGKIKRESYPTLYGEGYIGIGVYTTKDYKKAHIKWSSLMTRSYCKIYKQNKPSYKGVIVSVEWKCFQNFAPWFEDNYVEGWALDKGILVKGNKIYSPETCCFVPHEINSIFSHMKSKKNGLIGVQKTGKTFTAVINIRGVQTRLGIYLTEIEAFQVYKIAKEKYIKEVADEWKDKINPEVYNAMYNWVIEITD